ncbi:MAG: molybdopterin-binding/glycosyltransferase family 2 protein [Acidocella sp.]|nr:molybdopterin-binding/glycosyltransferase family 2 protein [Acidocella sp.]
MIFGRVALAQAQGAILAHNLKVSDRVLRKGALVDAAVQAMLAQAGYTQVTVVTLEPGDVPEGEAASRLGAALCTPDNLRCSEDVHGRVNLFAVHDGLLRVDGAGIGALNQIDEAITLATLADRQIVKAGDMVATLKIIPFAVAGAIMARADALISAHSGMLAVRRFAPLRVGLILSTLPQLKQAAITHTIAATQARVAAHGGVMLPPVQTTHESAPMAAAITGLLAAGADMILISGASAVTDRADVAPAAIIQAGGEITHFGLPVDPGNLMCFGQIGQHPAIVLPGCARSPALNGIDWVLDRIFAGDPVDGPAIAGMGVGGLLKEIETRPAPRTAKASGFGKAPRAIPLVAALVLAAGRSTRMGETNKLLAAMPGGVPMIRQTVTHVTASRARPVLVVTGHQDGAVRTALDGCQVRFIHAAGYAEGLAASLREGINALSADVAAAVICLGDMPLVTALVIDRLIAAFDPAEGREIILPRFDGQRGNPVLWGRRFFPALLALRGDAGARQILHHHMEFVAEMAVDEEAVLVDFDTPEALRAGQDQYLTK